MGERFANSGLDDASENVRAAEHVPYRLLDARAELDGGDGDPANMLIQGDNLDVLKALLPYYAGRVNCIYINPPYNTRSAFEHYDGNLEHSQWLAMIYPRLVLKAASFFGGPKMHSAGTCRES